MKLIPGCVFKSKDSRGDLAGELMFARAVHGDKIAVVFADGHACAFSAAELNVDPDSVRPYDADRDPDFLGLLV